MYITSIIQDMEIEGTEIGTCLTELGLKEDEVRQVRALLEKGQDQKAAAVLRNFRTQTLESLHKNQDDLYCIDFIIKKLLGSSNE